MFQDSDLKGNQVLSPEIPSWNRDLIQSWTSLVSLLVCIIYLGGLLPWQLYRVPVEILLVFVWIRTNQHDHMIKLNTSVSLDRSETSSDLALDPVWDPRPQFGQHFVFHSFTFFFLIFVNENKASVKKEMFSVCGCSSAEPGGTRRTNTTESDTSACHSVSHRRWADKWQTCRKEAIDSAKSELTMTIKIWDSGCWTFWSINPSNQSVNRTSKNQLCVQQQLLAQLYHLPSPILISVYFHPTDSDLFIHDHWWKCMTSSWCTC